MKKILLVTLITLFVVSCSGRGRTSTTSTDPTNLNTGNGNTASITCVDNATFSVTDNKCECNSGYKFDSQMNCVAIVCADHASLVNGTCVCDSGYKFDDQGINCLPIVNAKIKLAIPVILTKSGAYYFGPVTELISGNTVSTGLVHCIYSKLSTGGGVTDTTSGSTAITTACNDIAFTTALDCNSTVCSGATIQITKPGTYCLKAISCADGYETSDIPLFYRIIPPPITMSLS
ncbi:MAG: hypothetical protein NTY22_04850 [Proteobacteria bacterium]|nr:hypothetical protein [Pseudomonadota bacterium]